MDKDSEIGDWKRKSRGRRGRNPKLNFTDQDELRRSSAEIAMLASVFGNMVIPEDADQIAELPREIRKSLLERSSQKPTPPPKKN